MDELLIKVSDAISIEYMIVVIIASYFVIKVIDHLNGETPVESWVKRLVTCVVGVLMFWVFKTFSDVTFQTLVASFFAAVFFYDSAIKGLMKKFGIDYKSKNIC